MRAWQLTYDVQTDTACTCMRRTYELLSSATRYHSSFTDFTHLTAWPFGVTTHAGRSVSQLNWPAFACPFTRHYYNTYQPHARMSTFSHLQADHKRHGTGRVFHALIHTAYIFTARCTTVQSVVLLSHVVCPSVCLSVCDVGGSWPHRLKILETNCANN